MKGLSVRTEHLDARSRPQIIYEAAATSVQAILWRHALCPHSVCELVGARGRRRASVIRGKFVFSKSSTIKKNKNKNLPAVTPPNDRAARWSLKPSHLSASSQDTMSLGAGLLKGPITCAIAVCRHPLGCAASIVVMKGEFWSNRISANLCSSIRFY